MFSGLQLKPSSDVDKDDPIEQAKQLARKNVPKKSRKKRTTPNRYNTSPSRDSAKSLPIKKDMFSGLKINTKTKTTSLNSEEATSNEAKQKEENERTSESFDKELDIPPPGPSTIVSKELSDESKLEEEENETTSTLENASVKSKENTILEETIKSKEENQSIIDVSTEENGDQDFSAILGDDASDSDFDLFMENKNQKNNFPHDLQMDINEQVKKWVHEVEIQIQQNNSLQQSFLEEQSRIYSKKREIIKQMSSCQFQLEQIKSQQVTASEEENFALAIELDEQISSKSL